MGLIASFLRFWYDFIVGDDWGVAAGVVVALVLTGLLAHGGISDWWLMPIGVTFVLGISLWRQHRASTG